MIDYSEGNRRNFMFKADHEIGNKDRFQYRMTANHKAMGETDEIDLFIAGHVSRGQGVPN